MHADRAEDEWAKDPSILHESQGQQTLGYLCATGPLRVNAECEMQ